MDNTEREDACYKPAGVPVTPQARKLGYEFPVYVSDKLWNRCCVYRGSSRHQTNLDRRISELIASAYEGMIKKLAVRDDFLFYRFKHYYWPVQANSHCKKKNKGKFGARLFLNEDGSPWLYLFDYERDSIDSLEKGELNERDNSVEL